MNYIAHHTTGYTKGACNFRLGYSKTSKPIIDFNSIHIGDDKVRIKE